MDTGVKKKKKTKNKRQLTKETILSARAAIVASEVALDVGIVGIAIGVVVDSGVDSVVVEGATVSSSETATEIEGSTKGVFSVMMNFSPTPKPRST